MAEFFEACTQSPVNLVLSVLLALTLVYWIIVVLGAVGMDSLDFDFDIDAEADLDVDADLHGSSIGLSMLRFFGVGEVPLLILLTVLLLVMWAVGVLSYGWVGHWGILLQLLLLVPIFIVGVIVTQILTTPLRIMFRKMHEQEMAEQRLDLIGKTATVVSLTADAKHGQVEVVTNGNPIRLNVRTNDSDTVLQKGDEAVLVAEDTDSGVYLVRGF